MTRKTVHVLLAVVVGLILLLLVLEGTERDESLSSGGPLLPGFKALANDVTRIRVPGQAGGAGVTIHREADAWRVSARDGYVADIGKIRQLIIALADAGIVEEKTSNPERYAMLGVGDPEDGGSGTKIVLSGEDFVYSVILGETARRDFRYARVPDQATSYLIDRNPDVPTETGDWLSPEIIDIEAQQIRRVSILHGDGEEIVVAKDSPDQTDFSVLDIPDGRELSYATVGNGISGALGGLTMQDVRKQVEAEPTTTVIAVTWDGLEVRAEVVSEEDMAWVSFSAAAIPVEPADDLPEGSDSRDDGEPGADAEAGKLNERLAGWQYRLPDHKKNLFIRRWDDILKAAGDD